MANNITNNMTTQNDGHVASGMRHAEIAAHNCSGLTFKMTANITYTHTTDWDDAESTENNYTAIGRYGDLDTDLDFNGHFDGQGHTVSGIRIYKSGNDINTDSFQGLFGLIGNGSSIRGIILADARITSPNFVGGIVGVNHGTVSDSHVAANVAIHAVQSGTSYHGGIAGQNVGIVSDCTSAATLTKPNNVLGNGVYYGGIVGQNAHIGTLRHNLAIGAVVPAAQSRITNPGGVIIENKPYGAICGENAGGTLENNYYYACTVANVANATGVGSGIVNGNGTTTTRDVTDNDGAVPGIVLYDNSSRTDLNSYILTTVGNADVPRVQLAGRTLTKNGEWNTLCLPFALTAEQMAVNTHPLYGATIKQLDATNSNLAANGTLTLNFSAASSIEAGKPYIVRWGTPEDNPGGTIVDPVFTGVTISSTTPTAVTFSGGSFVGQYSPFAIDDSNINSVIMLGSGSTLGYSKNPRTLRSFRAHFEIPTHTGAPAMNSYVIDFGDESTGISLTPDPSPRGEGSEYYTLDGRKLQGKPTKKGMYIVNGKKVVIK